MSPEKREKRPYHHEPIKDIFLDYTTAYSIRRLKREGISTHSDIHGNVVYEKRGKSYKTLLGGHETGENSCVIIQNTNRIDESWKFKYDQDSNAIVRTHIPDSREPIGTPRVLDIKETENLKFFLRTFMDHGKVDGLVN